MERRTQFNIGYLLFALLAIFVLQQWWQQAQTVEVVPYSEFEKLLAADKIAEVVVSDSRITGKLKSPESGKTVAVANLVPPELAERLSKFGVPYTRVQESTFLRDVLSWVLPALVFFGIWWLMTGRINYWSLRQDVTGDPICAYRMRSAPAVPSCRRRKIPTSWNSSAAKRVG